MKENLKTIKEIADELGVSKTAINKKVTDYERKLWFSKIGNKFVVNEDGQKSIKSMFLDDNANRKPQTEIGNQKPKIENRKPIKYSTIKHIQSDSDVKYLLEIVQYQKEQIKDLKLTKEEHFKQISNMQNLLDQQQQLSLQDKKTIQKYEEENKDLHMMIDLNNTQKNDSELRKDDELPIEDKNIQSIRTKKGFFSRLFR